MVAFDNLNDEDYTLKAGTRLIQAVAFNGKPIKPHIVQELDATERNDGAFGSTGAPVIADTQIPDYNPLDAKHDEPPHGTTQMARSMGTAIVMLTIADNASTCCLYYSYLSNFIILPFKAVFQSIYFYFSTKNFFCTILDLIITSLPFIAALRVYT